MNSSNCLSNSFSPSPSTLRFRTVAMVNRRYSFARGGQEGDVALEGFDTDV